MGIYITNDLTLASESNHVLTYTSSKLDTVSCDKVDLSLLLTLCPVLFRKP